ncbi:trypsin-like serine peptidase [Spirillospora sp. CA-294931]|uniref:trypsin-like serine peptidase n=1 Tax=Spirillospora sp. CA-294931 TaxID=3240042 RepID=UPI003D94AE67
MHMGRMRLAAVAVTSTGIVAAGAGTVFFFQGSEQTRTVADMSASQEVGAAEAGATERYWTPKRMASATPLTGRSAQGARAQAGPTAKAYGGIPTLGALFFRNGRGDHYCTASVVHSYSKRLLLTAAHCIHGGKGGGYGRYVAFVPKYDRGKRPYGTWAASKLFVDRRWIAQSDPDLDFGYVALKPVRNRRIESVVGANKLAVNQSPGRWTHVAGYPHIRHDRRDRPIYCNVKTRRHSRFQLRMDCGGFYGGTSGSPWLINYSTRTQRGLINGVLGGHQGGGNVHYTSYSPYFDKDVYNLRAAADKASR